MITVFAPNEPNIGPPTHLLKTEVLPDRLMSEYCAVIRSVLFLVVVLSPSGFIKEKENK